MNHTVALLARSRRPCSLWMESFTANLVSRVEVDACPEGPFSGVSLLLSAGQGTVTSVCLQVFVACSQVIRHVFA